MRRPVLTVLVVVSLGAAAEAAPAFAAGCPGRVAAAAGLARVAFLAGGRLEVLDLSDCRLRTLVTRGASAPVRWSADGRYIGFGAGAVVPAAGGPVTYPIGVLARGFATGSPAWLWSPAGHLLVGVGRDGGVRLGAPGRRSTALVPAGWGATSVAFSPDGAAVAVSRSRYPRAGHSFAEQVWLVQLASGSRRVVYRVPAGQVEPPWLAGFAPDGRWLLAWQDAQSSASLAADGLPLVALPLLGGSPHRVGTGTLVDGDFLSWCGARLAYVLNRGGREVTLGDRIALAGPPGWRAAEPAALPERAHLSFISPACAPRGGSAIAAAAGPETADDPLGQERRRIWLLSGPGARWRPLEREPPAGSSDELPTWSPSGRVIAFVRTTWRPARGLALGRLYLLELGARPGSPARLVGPLAGVGSTSDEDGHFGWDAQLAWER